jgi:hypothetical protein
MVSREIEAGCRGAPRDGRDRGELRLPAAQPAARCLPRGPRHGRLASRPRHGVARPPRRWTQPTGCALCRHRALEAPTPSAVGASSIFVLPRAATSKPRPCSILPPVESATCADAGRGGRPRRCGARCQGGRVGEAQASAHGGGDRGADVPIEAEVAHGTSQLDRKTGRLGFGEALAIRRQGGGPTRELEAAVIVTAGCISVRPSIGVARCSRARRARPRTAASSERSASSRHGRMHSAMAVSRTSWLVAPRWTCGRAAAGACSRNRRTRGTARVAERLPSATSASTSTDIPAQAAAMASAEACRYHASAACAARAPIRTRASRARMRRARTRLRRRGGRACGR